MDTMKLTDALRKSQKQYKGMKLPKWEDCKTATPEEIQMFISYLIREGKFNNTKQ